MNKIVLILIALLFCINPSLSKGLSKDYFVEESLSKVEVSAPKPITEYDFSDTDCVKIPLRITERITTQLRHKSYEGQKLEFLVDNDVYYNNKLLVKKGAKATARLEILTTRGFAGVPAEIFITDFEIPDLDSNKIKEPVSKRGFSVTTLILPVKWALTPFPPFGSLTNLFVGFNTSLTKRNKLNVYYYPNIHIE